MKNTILAPKKTSYHSAFDFCVWRYNTFWSWLGKVQRNLLPLPSPKWSSICRILKSMLDERDEKKTFWTVSDHLFEATTCLSHFLIAKYGSNHNQISSKDDVPQRSIHLELGGNTLTVPHLYFRFYKLSDGILYHWITQFKTQSKRW